MNLPEGDYRFELRIGANLVAREECRLEGSEITGSRRLEAGGRYRVQAWLNSSALVERMTLNYSASMFERKAVYEAKEDSLEGKLSILTGSDAVNVRLGRFREVDASLTLFKALIIGHIRERGQALWTGRVAVIDPTTLAASSVKHTYRQVDDTGRKWICEPRLGDREEIELDELGRLTKRVDHLGMVTSLLPGHP